MRLCFGTYARIFWLCAAESVGKYDIVAALVRSVDKNCMLTAPATTGLLRCENGLPNGRGKSSLGDVISGARSCNPNAVSDYFSSSIIPLISPAKYLHAIYAIRRLINEDKSIRGDTIVQLVSGFTKDGVLNDNNISAADFLAGVFLYTISVDNRSGAECVKSIDDDFILSTLIPDAQTTAPSPIKKASTHSSLWEKANKAYLKNAAHKYNLIKTMFYADEPKSFYGFYVPNDIGHPRVGRDIGTVINNATVAKLTSVSNFIILDGYGGVGKTMMMRHLLLDAIKENASLHLLPVFIALKGYRGEPLVTFIFSIVHVICPTITPEMMENVLSQGNALLLFDGLDEISEANANFSAFESELEKLVDRYPDNKYIISSRTFKSFVSYARFTILRILPFTLEQSIMLVKKLDYRADDGEFKDGFISELRGKLSSRHQSFIENPLLLTILIMTYSKFRNIPDKMYEFYHRAFLALVETHDDAKGNFKRVHKTGLNTMQFNHVFSEFSFHTYADNKSEMTIDEFSGYFDHIRIFGLSPSDAKSLAIDFTINLCLLMLEGDKYYFIHRTFQEYFCAVFFSRQDSKFLKLLGEFFECRRDSGIVLSMLHDMATDKVEAYIFIPFLENLLNECDGDDGYLTFLEKMYPSIQYVIGEDMGYYPENSPTSFLLEFIVSILLPNWEIHCDCLPTHNATVINEYTKVQGDDDVWEAVEIKDIPFQCPLYQGESKITSGIYELNIAKMKKHKSMFEDHLNILNDDKFVFKSEFLAIQAFLPEIKKRHAKHDNLITQHLIKAIKKSSSQIG